MNQESIEALIRHVESQVFERKRSLGLKREGLESLCGMINADDAEGTVAFGIGPDGQIVGVEPGDLDKAQRSLSQTIAKKFDPAIRFTIRVLELEGKRVVVLMAQRNRDVPYHEYDGRAFIREGTVTRQLTLSEKQSFQRQRNRDLHTGPWRCNRCGSWVDMLGGVTITDQGVRKSYACNCGGEYWPAAYHSVDKLHY
jgi:predicted HTH transcriptional regulator